MVRSRPVAAVIVVAIRHQLVEIPFVLTVMALATLPVIVSSRCIVASVRVVSILPDRVLFRGTGRYPLARLLL